MHLQKRSKEGRLLGDNTAQPAAPESLCCPDRRRHIPLDGSHYAAGRAHSEHSFLYSLARLVEWEKAHAQMQGLFHREAGSGSAAASGYFLLRFALPTPQKLQLMVSPPLQQFSTETINVKSSDLGSSTHRLGMLRQVA